MRGWEGGFVIEMFSRGVIYFFFIVGFFLVFVCCVRGFVFVWVF